MSKIAKSYRLSPLAENDLEDIWLYSFQSWSLEQADNYVANILASFDGLTAGVNIGRVSDIRAGYYKYNVGKHIIFYQQSEIYIDIIRILHQQMDCEIHL